MATITVPPRMVDPGLLTLSQWLSPAFPLGAFAYSHGLEQALRGGWIADGDELRAWLDDTLHHGSGRNDAIWLRLASECDDPCPLDAEARAFAAARERVIEAERQGAAFVRVTNAVWGLELPDLLLPIAVGRAVGLMGLDVEAAVTLYLHGFTGNQIQAAMRLMPLGQTEGQAILAALRPTCLELAEATRGVTLDDVGALTFLSDIAAMRHEVLEPRIFAT